MSHDFSFSGSIADTLGSDRQNWGLSPLFVTTLLVAAASLFLLVLFRRRPRNALDELASGLKQGTEGPDQAVLDDLAMKVKRA
jgi:hypothetical protein